jgi:hypothetical protein
MIRHGYKLRKLGSSVPKGSKVKVPKSRESIEIRIRDPDGKLLFSWDAARGNLKQGIYECLDFTDRGLGLSLDDILVPQEKVVREKVAEIGSATRSAVERAIKG